ncbi:MAG: UDP-N-acetylmuramate dehydrogenase, partial [Pseudomonadota bacterium]
AGLKNYELQTGENVYAQAGLACAKLARFVVSNHYTGLEFMAGIPGTVGGALAMNAGAFGGQTWDKVISVDVIDRDGKVSTRDADEYQVDYRYVKQRKGEWFVGAKFSLDKTSDQNQVISIKELLDKRSATQPIGKKNCGSVFKNPENCFAAELIEKCGLKGYSIGGACVSIKHANFIINENNASATDIENLMWHVKNTVEDECGIKLEAEVKILGDEQ